MKIKTLSALCCIWLSTAPGSALAQDNQPAYQAPLASESLLLDIITNDQKLVAVGERGHVLISEDGENWEQQNVPSQATLNGVFMLGDNIWAVGHDAIILASKDGGKSWTIQQFLPDLERPLFDLHFFDENHGIAVGAYGIFFRTKNGGETWEREYHTEFLHPDDQEYVESLREEDPQFFEEEMASILPHLNRMSESNGVLYTAGETGLLAKSDSQGEKWERLESGYYGSFFDVVKSGNETILAAGLRGNLYKSSDGLDWSKVETNTTYTINSIVELTGDKSLFVGNNGVMIWKDGNDIKVEQSEQGKALTAAVLFGEKIIAVSEVGITTIDWRK